MRVHNTYICMDEFNEECCLFKMKVLTTLSRTQQQQKYGKKTLCVISSDLELDENSAFLKLKADTLKDESEKLVEPRRETGGLDYPEVISDIISQVLINISQGRVTGHI